MTATWAGFFELMCLAAAFFAAGWLWREESAYREEEQRAARRRAHRLRYVDDENRPIR
jgi:hypothetical protein